MRDNQCKVIMANRKYIGDYPNLKAKCVTVKKTMVTVTRRIFEGLSSKATIRWL